MAHVVDASVVIKWYVIEVDSDAATDLLNVEDDLPRA
jgi:predicted nucleic acid-binding protein